MEVQAIIRYARISQRKACALAHRLRNLPVPQALGLVEANKQKGALLLLKTLKSAVANAENNHKVSAEGLRVKEAVVETGPALKRYWPRARGMAARIRKRTSHIRVTLTDEKPGR